MFQEAADFCAESEALYVELKDLDDQALDTPTLFKGWTFNDVLGHLHFWNLAAVMSVEDEAALVALLGRAASAIPKGGLRPFEDEQLGHKRGETLREAWRDGFLNAAERLGSADPKMRVKWAGPPMSVRSSVTARLMETWAHGQAVYDALGKEREDTDRIRGIAFLGINTYGWTFANRGLEVPDPPPWVRLEAPSGETWEWNESSDTNWITGRATEFCQVVAQTRNVADTHLKVVGEIATRWMAIAQCFAGPPTDPPGPGTRHKADH